jgi:hypothetical protein
MGAPITQDSVCAVQSILNRSQEPRRPEQCIPLDFSSTHSLSCLSITEQLIKLATFQQSAIHYN